jgi:hypothetical protein
VLKLFSVSSIALLGFGFTLKGQANGPSANNNDWFGTDSQSERQSGWAALGNHVTALFGVLSAYGGCDTMSTWPDNVLGSKLTGTDLRADWVRRWRYERPRTRHTTRAQCDNDDRGHELRLGEHSSLHRHPNRGYARNYYPRCGKTVMQPSLYNADHLDDQDFGVALFGTAGGLIACSRRIRFRRPKCTCLCHCQAVRNCKSKTYFPGILANRHFKPGEPESEYYTEKLRRLPSTLQLLVLRFGSSTVELRRAMEILISVA